MKTKLVILLWIMFGIFKLNGQTTQAGTLASLDTVKCVLANSGTLQLSGHVGNILRWEYSYTNGSPWTSIAHTSAIYNFTNLVQTTFFRAVVQYPSSIALNSAPLKIQVDPVSIAGQILGNENVCFGDLNSFVLDGSRGKIMQWMESANNGFSWTAIPNSVDNLSISKISSGNILYKVQVKNSVCPAEETPSFQVSVFQQANAGTISGTDSVCFGTNAVQLSTTGSSASNLSWETSVNQNGPWLPMGETSTSILYQNIHVPTFFRVIGNNAACPKDTSAIHKVVGNIPPIGGNILGDSAVCSGYSTVLNLANFSGQHLTWQKSADNGTNWANTSFLVPEMETDALSQNYSYRVKVENNNCAAVYSTSKNITVNQPPLAAFTINNVCANTPITTNNQSIGATSYDWNLGNGTSSTVDNPSVIYSNPNSYTIKLKAISSFGCIDSTQQTIQVFSTPLANFTHPDTICLHDVVVFTNLSQNASSSISASIWSFNNANSISSLHATYSLLPAGTNSVKLKISSANGCQDSIVKSIVVRENPIVQFGANTACLGNATNFVNTSYPGSGSANYHWDFGNGNQSNAISPSETYLNSGNYNVQLIAENDYLCNDTLILPIVVNDTPSVNFAFSNICLYDSAEFVSSLSPAGAQTLWDFGDGSTSNLTNPSHLYSYPNNYIVQLTATLANGCFKIKQQTLEVFPVPQTDFILPNGCEQDSLQTQNLSTISNGTLTYAWDFGNGQFSSENAPKMLFFPATDYPIQLISSSNHGCLDTMTKTISIFDKPTVSFLAPAVCYGYPTAFSNTSSVQSGTIDSYIWNFGDNSNSTLENPVKEYINSGEYQVSLQAESSNGCVQSASQLVKVYDTPIADFDVLSNCLGDETTFSNTSTIGLGVFSSAWTFGDNDASTEFAPIHLYESAGFYTAQVIITSDFGCVDSLKKPLVIYSLPVVNAGIDTTIEKGFGYYLNASGGVNYTWQPAFGLENPQIANPYANPTSSTSYLLTVLDKNGCFGSDSIVISVEDSYRVIPYNILTPDGNLQNDTWIIKNIENYPNNEIRIFNEMGYEVYYQASYDNTWEGRNKSGEILPDGTYYYVLQFTGVDKNYKGDLLLIRNKN